VVGCNSHLNSADARRYIFVQGLPIVRAFRAEGRFFRTCCERIDDMNRYVALPCTMAITTAIYLSAIAFRCHLYLWISNRWLSFRMQVLGAMVAGLVGLAGECCTSVLCCCARCVTPRLKVTYLRYFCPLIRLCSQTTYLHTRN
jgi:hypothetical protein